MVEYFKGNCDDMRDDIFNHIKNEEILPDYKDDKYEEIKIMFPDYKYDESFGGKKKFIKIIFENDRIYSYYIDDDKNIENSFLQRSWFKNDDNLDDYISKLIQNNIIQDGMIYNFNDNNFINKLNKYKEKINITYTEEDISSIKTKFNKIEKNNIYFKINNILYNNCILNEAIYCDYINNNYNYLIIDFIVPYNKINKTEPEFIKKTIYIIKINKLIFDYDFLIKYTPYCMDLKEDKYYFYNRNYQIINKDEKQYSIKDWNGERIYFEGEIGLIYSKDTTLFKKYILNIKNKISNITCMNMNEYTSLILSLY